MKQGVIDLDLLDKKIFQAQIELKDNPSEDLLLILSERFSCLKYIRSKCTPIEPPVFLSKTCINIARRLELVKCVN